MDCAQLEQFAADLHQEILADAGVDAETTGESNCFLREEVFTQYVLGMLGEHNEADDAEICYFAAKGAGRTPATKLNAWALSGDGATLDLFVSLYHGIGKRVEVGVPETRRHFKLVVSFLRRSLDGFYTTLEEANTAFYAAKQIYETKELLTTVRLFFFTDGVVRSMEDIEDEVVPGLEVKSEVWDLDKLSRLRVGERALIELDFVNDYGGPIPCLQTKDATGEYQTFLAFLPAPMLAQIYGKYSQRLLERNVRAFLQAKGKVNRGLQKTLREEPHRFLAYNNGLCCTAAEVRLREGANGHALLEHVKDFQVVNGGQTTASIFHAEKKEKTDIRAVVVQMKLTVLQDADRALEMVPRISQYANNQNKINTADFSANGKFHRELEGLSRSVYVPAASGRERGTHWYYERARGSYADDRSRQGTNVRRHEWELSNPPRQKFTKTDLAKFEHAWLGRPHLVCLGAEKNFIKFCEWMDDEGELTVDLNYFHQLIAKAILFKTEEELFVKEELEGYRANSVAYALAWLAERSGRRIDLYRIYQEQAVPLELKEALRETLKEAHYHIISCDGNPGEASKSKDCWEAFKDKKIALNSKWEDELAENAFLPVSSESDALAAQWEDARHHFAQDARTIQELERYTGREWMSKHRKQPVAHFSVMDYCELKKACGKSTKNVRAFIAMLSNSMSMKN